MSRALFKQHVVAFVLVAMAGRVAKPWVILVVGLWMTCRVQNICFVQVPQVGRGGQCNSIKHDICVAVVLTFAWLDPKAVSALRAPNQHCWRIGQLVGSCMMIAPAPATDEPTHLPSVQHYVAQNKDFLVGTAAAYIAYLQSEQDRRQADEEFRASDEYKFQTAVQDFLQPFEISYTEEQVVKRDVMEAINELVRTWCRRAQKTTIVTGCYQAGKTVAINEALRGVRGVSQVSAH